MPAAGNAFRMIMVLGRRDEPVDAVRDYANCLSEALRTHGIGCQSSEVRWYEKGWLVALARLWRESRAWRDRWVILHYTALMWSRRGFPVAVPIVLKILSLRGCRTAIVFHDGYALAGSRWVDRFRVSFQQRIMRHLAINALRVIVPVPVEGIPWLRKLRIEFIPVGANIPSLDDLARQGVLPLRNAIPTVAIFGIPSWPAAQKREVEAIVQSVMKASERAGVLQLLVLGRGAKEAESLLRAGLQDSNVRLQVDGLRSSQEISAALAGCDVLLFVRGPLSSRRGSGLAAIACGLPIVAYQGRETGFPLTEAGILFVPQDNTDSLGNELARILLDRELRLRLRERSLSVFREWFAWDRIADRWAKALAYENEDFVQ